jgi:intracellular septation protein A
MLVSSEPRPDSATTATPALINHDDLVAQRVGGFLACLLAVTLPIQLPGFESVSIGFAFAVLLLPTIVPVVVRMIYGRALTRTALLVLIAAPFVTAATLSMDHSRSFSNKQAILSAALFLGLVLQICGVAWASSIIGIRRVALLYSVGAILNAAIQPALWATNPWKYAFGWCVPLLIIAAFYRWPRSLQPLGIVLAALYALTHESRNSAAALILTLLATAATYILVSRKTERRQGLLILGMLVAGTLAIVSLVTQLAASGALGEQLQRVQISQSSSNTAIAGRDEYLATFALMAQSPIGLGPGVIPSFNDITVGKVGLSVVAGADTSGSYVDGYMFNDGFNVHSVAGDLWVEFGIAGLLFAAIMMVTLIRAALLNHESPPSGLTALYAFLFFQGVWDLLFSPLNGNFRSVGFAAGAAIFLLSQARDRRRDPESLPALPAAPAQ